MNKIIIILIIIGEIMGLYMFCMGIKKNKNIDDKFKIKHLFRNTSFTESSGIQLMIEGSFIIISGIIFYLVWF